MYVDRSSLVTGAQLSLSTRGRHDDLYATDEADRPILSCVDEDVLTEALLDAIAVDFELHGMDIDPSVLAGKLHPDGKPVLDDVIAAGREPLEEAADRSRVDEEVEVAVLTGLTADQCIDAPSSVDLVGHIAGDQPLDDRPDLVGGHESGKSHRGHS